MAWYISFMLLSIFTVTIMVLFFIDSIRKLKPHHNPKISFIIPCYNDGHVVRQCIESIYASYNPDNFELIVINDCSKDNSADVIKKMQSDYDFTFIDLPKNGGKSDALNHASKYAKYDIISFIDADAEINTTALNDVLNRFETFPRMWAISCPYLPSNMGSFWSYMQDIEYTMLRFVQWTYNIKSALAARWGCLTVRKQAFKEIWWFSPHAITEDMYLAMHMNAHGRIVHQSPYQIKSEVPDNFKVWLKQKIRRCSGAVQAFLSHISVWIRNPMHVIYTLLIHIVSVVGTVALITRLIFFGELVEILMVFVDVLTFKSGRNVFMVVYGNEVIQSLIYTSVFALFSLPYVIFAIKNTKQLRKILLLFPYVIVYMTIYSIVGLYSTGVGIYKFITLEKGKRSW